MRNRAQTTLFIILAFIIVSLVLLISFVYKDNLLEVASELTTPSEVAYIRGEIESCLSLTVRDALHYLGQQGGYYSPDDFVEDYSGIRVQYYYKKGKFLVPERVVLEKEIEKFIDLQLPICLTKLTPKGYSLTTKKPKTSVNFKNSLVVVHTQMPVVIRKEAKIYKLKNFNAEESTEILGALNIAKEVLSIQMFGSTEGLCVSCLSSYVQEKGFTAEVTSIGEDMIVTIKSKEDEILRFAVLF